MSYDVLLSPNLRLLADAMSEEELMGGVCEHLELFGWTWCHVRPAMKKKNGEIIYGTPIMGHKGLPDLIMGRDGVVMLWELKAEHGRVAPEQERFLEAVGGRIVRPSDLLSGWVEEMLR